MAAKLKLDLIVDDKGSVVVKHFGKAAHSAFTVAKGGAIALGAGIASAVAGLYAANKVMSEAVGLANVQEKAETKLGAVIEATGHAAGYNLEQMKAMAVGMQEVTTVGDEVILNGMAILGTFKKIQGEGFERTTQAALDMSAVMEQDLKSSMVMIGKAMNDPIKNLSAMTRAGVQFSDQQKDMIAMLWESGDAAGAQAIILKELESQFGGAAAALRETFGGSVDAATNSLGDMKEEIGFVITKNKFMIDLVHMAEAQFKAWGGQIKDNREMLQQLTKTGVLYLVDGITTALEVMRFFHNGWLGIKLVGNLAINTLAVALEGLIKGLRVLLTPLDLLFESLVKLGKMEANPFDRLEGAAIQFRASSIDVTKDVIRDIEKTNKAYDGVIKQVKTWKKGIEEIPVAHTKTAKAVKKATEDMSGYYWDSYEQLSDAEQKALEEMYYGAEKKKKKTKETTSAMTNAYTSFARDSQSSVSTILYDSMRGETASFADYWASFTDGLYGILADTLSRMVFEWLMYSEVVRSINSTMGMSGGAGGMYGGGMQGQGGLTGMVGQGAQAYGAYNALWGGAAGSAYGSSAAEIAANTAIYEATPASTWASSGIVAQYAPYLTTVGGAAVGGYAGSKLGEHYASNLGLKESEGRTLGGVAGGAAVGTMIMPGVGTVVGGIIGGIASMFHDGGFVKAHQGMFLKPDERPIIAQVGEGILNRQATARIGGEAGVNALNRGESISTPVINNKIDININAELCTTDKAAYYIAEVMRKINQQKIGDTYQTVEIATAGLDI